MTTGNKWVELLKSRRLWLAVVAVIQTVALQTSGVDPAIWQTINAVIVVLIAILTVDDTAATVTTTIHKVHQAKADAEANANVAANAKK